MGLSLRAESLVLPNVPGCRPFKRGRMPQVRDPLEMEPYCYPLGRDLLRRHIAKVRARQRGVPEDLVGASIPGK